MRATSPLPPATVVAAGYRGLKFDPFWGLGRDPGLAELRRGIEDVAAVRAAVGPDVQVFVDGHGRFSVGTASRLAHALAESGVDWFEEPVDPENYIALGQVARPPGLQIAVGERCYSRYQVPQLLAEGRPHILQPDPIQVGGLLEAKKISVLADSAYLPVSFHCPFGPIATRRDPSTLCRDDQRRPPGILFGIRCRLAPRAHHKLPDACRRQLPGERAAWPGRHRTQ